MRTLPELTVPLVAPRSLQSNPPIRRLPPSDLTTASVAANRAGSGLQMELPRKPSPSFIATPCEMSPLKAEWV